MKQKRLEEGPCGGETNQKPARTELHPAARTSLVSNFFPCGDEMKCAQPEYHTEADVVPVSL